VTSIPGGNSTSRAKISARPVRRWSKPTSMERDIYSDSLLAAGYLVEYWRIWQGLTVVAGSGRVWDPLAAAERAI
jgi:hypothetical protein